MLDTRAKTLVERLPGGFEAALVLTPDNRFYLLDFDSHDAGALLLFEDGMVFIIDSRYIEAALGRVENAQVVLETDAMGQIAEALAARGVKKLLVEDGITVAKLAQLQEKLDVTVDAGPLLSRVLREMRTMKTLGELERMYQAQLITDACFNHILGYIKVGMREIDIMLEMEHYMRSHGAEKVAFDTICIAGASTSLPHGVPGENRVQEGDFVTMDFGAKFEGYCTDMTRTIAVGEPGEEKRRVYGLVLEAHLAGLAAVVDGVKGSDVDRVARDIIYKAGYEGCFGHGLGHSLGIDVHENPRFSPTCHDTIRAGMMMTVEPGIYLPGRFGVRIEDTVLVTHTGCESLTSSEKQLIVL